MNITRLPRDKHLSNAGSPVAHQRQGLSDPAFAIMPHCCIYCYMIKKKLRKHWKLLFDIDKVDLVKKDGKPSQLINRK